MLAKKKKVVPVILAGGSGTRLWPLSRKSYPKQFSNLTGGDLTLLQQCALRVAPCDQIEFEQPVILTNSDFRFIIREQLNAIGLRPKTIVIEPEQKNTAPAILAASLLSQVNDPESILLVLPSDHIVSDDMKFHQSVHTALKQTDADKIVTFGIKPSYPETGYGYMELGEVTNDDDEVFKVERFIEKPDHHRAKQMVEDRNHLWNSGIFLFKASQIIESFKKYCPEILELTLHSVQNAEVDLDFLRLRKEPWSQIESVSIDYAIIEKLSNLVVVPFNSYWSDLGGWEAVWRESDKDEHGTVVSSGAHSVECVDSLLRSESNTQELIGIGLEKIIAIAMPDAVLVAHRDRSQDVKKIVDDLKSKSVSQAEKFLKEYRPWGWFESLAFGKRFQVKRICVNPGEALSLQSHDRRSEHWVVVEGTARVTVEGRVQLVGEGESVYVPLKAVHRLENPGADPIILIEVQTGSYFGEDDIIRYDDRYARK